MHTHLCPIYLYGWTLNDLTSYYNKTELTEQSILAGGEPPCIIVVVLYMQTDQGSYINWLAVSSKEFDTTRFGKLGTGLPF